LTEITLEKIRKIELRQRADNEDQDSKFDE
jgi:hypothetical protein